MRPPVDISVGGDNDTTGVGEWGSCLLLAMGAWQLVLCET